MASEIFILKVIHLRWGSVYVSSHSGYYLGLLYYEPIIIYVTSGYKDFVSRI